MILLLGLVVLPRLLTGTLGSEEAKEGVRLYYLQEVTDQQLSELEESGMSSPDQEMALRWKEQNDRLDSMEFVSIEVKRAILAPPFRRRAEFAVKAVVHYEDRQNHTRYFWFNGVYSGSVSESSKLEWYFPI